MAHILDKALAVKAPKAEFQVENSVAYLLHGGTMSKDAAMKESKQVFNVVPSPYSDPMLILPGGGDESQFNAPLAAKIVEDLRAGKTVDLHAACAGVPKIVNVLQTVELILLHTKGQELMNNIRLIITEQAEDKDIALSLSNLPKSVDTTYITSLGRKETKAKLQALADAKAKLPKLTVLGHPGSNRGALLLAFNGKKKEGFAQTLANEAAQVLVDKAGLIGIKAVAAKAVLIMLASDAELTEEQEATRQQLAQGGDLALFGGVGASVTFLQAYFAAAADRAQPFSVGLAKRLEGTPMADPTNPWFMQEAKLPKTTAVQKAEAEAKAKWAAENPVAAAEQAAKTAVAAAKAALAKAEEEAAKAVEAARDAAKAAAEAAEKAKLEAAGGGGAKASKGDGPLATGAKQQSEVVAASALTNG